MKRAILYSFYKDFDVCKNHIEVLRAFNPGVEIYGIYGGPQLDSRDLRELKLDNLWMNPCADGYRRWRHGDIFIAEWFRNIGHAFQFDMLHCFDWDVVLLAPVAEYFHHINDGIALSGVIPLSKIIDTWRWTSGGPGRAEWLSLHDHVKQIFNYTNTPLAGLGCGMSLSHDFLQRYSEIDPTELCCCETRLPLYAQCFGMPVHESGMLHSKYFGFEDKKLKAGMILGAHKQGIKAFHPVRFQIPGGIIHDRVNS